MLGRIFRTTAGALAAVGLVATGAAEAGDKRTEAVELVADAVETTAYFAADSAFEPLWNLADDAKAIVVIPEQIRAGFIIGGAAGDAVMLARNDDGTWSQPTFLTVGALSVGFQAGGEASEIVLLVMTQRGMEHLLSTSVKLGADVSVAAGPVGAGAKVATTDILAFSRSRGLYGGVSLEGSILKTRRNRNKAYYNANVSPGEIIYRGDVYNPASAPLQNAVWRLANKDAPATLAPAAIMPEAPSTYPRQSNGVEAAPLGAPVYDKPKSDEDYEDDRVWGAPIGEPQ